MFLPPPPLFGTFYLPGEVTSEGGEVSFVGGEVFFLGGEVIIGNIFWYWEGTRKVEKRRGYVVVNVLYSLCGWGLLGGLGVWFVLFRAYWIEEKIFDTSLRIAFTQVNDDNFCSLVLLYLLAFSVGTTD